MVVDHADQRPALGDAPVDRRRRLAVDPGGDAVAGAWVRVETPSGVGLQTTETSELGRFTFGALRFGPYRLRAIDGALGEITRDVDVPSPEGEYDLAYP